MWTLDDLKTDRDTQITAICIGFFLIAFPLYFSIAASGVDATSGLGGVRDYEVTGDLMYVELASGGEYIADGTTYNIENLHTDAIDGAEDMNIVGVRLTMTYGEDEQAQGGLCQSGTAPDTITGTAMHAGFNESTAGQNSGTGHATTVEWYNSSMIGVISGFSEAEIKAEIDSMGAGLGAYEASIEVSAEGDSCANPLLQGNGDDGEDVSYVVELIVFDYAIAPYIELTDV